MKKIILEVDGMKCGGCSSKIKEHFLVDEKVENVAVDLESKKVEISGSDDLSNMTIRNEVIELGFSVVSMRKE
tara:strand:+ start:253556 stop:253774 length:219 start_codon:yes stop_codon:yes gene_type:complete